MKKNNFTRAIARVVCAGFAVLVMGCLTTTPATQTSNRTGSTATLQAGMYQVKVGDFTANVLINIKGDGNFEAYVPRDGKLVFDARGNYRINGNQITMTFTHAVRENFNLSSATYTITSSTSFEGHGEFYRLAYTVQ